MQKGYSINSKVISLILVVILFGFLFVPSLNPLPIINKVLVDMGEETISLFSSFNGVNEAFRFLMEYTDSLSEMYLIYKGVTILLITSFVAMALGLVIMLCNVKNSISSILMKLGSVLCFGLCCALLYYVNDMKGQIFEGLNNFGYLGGYISSNLTGYFEIPQTVYLAMATSLGIFIMSTRKKLVAPVALTNTTNLTNTNAEIVEIQKDNNNPSDTTIEKTPKQENTQTLPKLEVNYEKIGETVKNTYSKTAELLSNVESIHKQNVSKGQSLYQSDINATENDVASYLMAVINKNKITQNIFVYSNWLLICLGILNAIFAFQYKSDFGSLMLIMLLISSWIGIIGLMVAYVKKQYLPCTVYLASNVVALLMLPKVYDYVFYEVTTLFYIPWLIQLGIVGYLLYVCGKKYMQVNNIQISNQSVKTIECPNCHAMCDVNSKFCGNCGSELKAEEENKND